MLRPWGPHARRHLRSSRAAARIALPFLVASALVAVAAPASSVTFADPDHDAQPSQASLDQTQATGIGGWGNMTGGVASRPYVLALSVTNGGVTTSVISNGTTTPPATADGGVTATIEPYNLCATTPAGDCYSTPNRVGVSVVYAKSPVVGSDFAHPSVTPNPTIDANSVIDLTLALNTLGQSLRWTWVNGDLLYWRTTDLGTPGATLRLRFRPALRPWVDWSTASANGCTASPPMNCDIAAGGEVLTASLVLSLDDSLDPALTGAAFATQGAFFGYLEPGGDPATGPLLTVKASSTHFMSDGTTPQLGIVQAFIPSAAIVNLFGVLPADAASSFTVARSSGDGGTQGTPTYETWTAAANGADGLLITVPDVTFSVPAYDVSQSLWFLSGAQVAAGRTTIDLAMLDSGCTRRNPCTLSVYDIGTDAAARLSARPTRVATVTYTGSDSVSVRSSRLPEGHMYLVYVVSRRTAIASSMGYVCPEGGDDNPETPC